MVAAELLDLLPPERAHGLALRLLPLMPPRPPPDYPRLRTCFAGLELAHPIGLAAGFDKNAKAIAGLFRAGFAFVEVGTVTPEPQAGNPRPRLFRLVDDRALINRLGFNNDGLVAMSAQLAAARERRGVLGVNIGMNRNAADPAADYARCLERLMPLTDYITLNVSSPNTPGLRDLQGEAALQRLLTTLAPLRRPGRPPPLFLKVAPDLADEAVPGIVATAAAHGVDALIVGNTTLDRPAGLRSSLRAESGGLSGPPLFARSTRLLARFARALDGRLPLIGVGGVGDGAGAYAKIWAGASAVQLYTSFIYQGPRVIGRVLAELDALLVRDSYADLTDAVGRDTLRLAELPLDQTADAT